MMGDSQPGLGSGLLGSKGSESPGDAMVSEQAHLDNVTNSYKECWVVGVEFIFLAVETLGGWHNQAMETIKTLSRQLG